MISKAKKQDYKLEGCPVKVKLIDTLRTRYTHRKTYNNGPKRVESIKK